MPYMRGLALLGDDDNSGTLAPAVQAWQARVRATGGVPTRMPYSRDRANSGKLAARFPDARATAGWRYVLADAAALEADGRGAAVLSSQIVAGKRVEDLEKSVTLLKQGAAAALDLPRNVAAGVLGIPPWLVTVLVLGGGALVVKTFLPHLPSMARRNPPRPVRRARGRARR